MWSLKITTEQRYKSFDSILPDIKTDIKLFWNLPDINGYASKIYSWEEDNNIEFHSFIIERTLDNQYQITFYE